MERIGIQARSQSERPFRVNVEAGDLGSCEMSPSVLSLRVAQRMFRANTLEMWNTVSVFCEEEAGGALVVRVMVFNPDWDGPLQIAELRSWPSDPSQQAPMRCNLDHIGSHIGGTCDGNS
jgi:hypothetical protein